MKIVNVTQTNRQSGHLTDDQFADCALDAPGPEAQAHLDGCARCRGELEAFQVSVGDFSSAAMGWSESQPSVSLRAAETAYKRRPLLAYGAAAIAAGLALAVAVPAVWHHSDETPGPVAVVQEDSAAQIAEDNRMMQSVNMAIGVREPSPFSEYRLQDVRSSRSASRAETRNE